MTYTCWLRSCCKKMFSIVGLVLFAMAWLLILPISGIANERAIGVTNEWASSIIEGDTSMLLMLFCLEIHELEYLH